MFLLIFLSSCGGTIIREKRPPLDLQYGFRCSGRTAVIEGKETEICSITKEDREVLDNYILFWCG